MADHGVVPPGRSVDTTSVKMFLDARKHVKLGKEKVYDVAATDFPGHDPTEAHAWDLQVFKSNLHIVIGRLSDEAIEFDLVGVDASVANALRRILISEVPTVAIETVYIWNNTSLVQDEVLAQRLGLIPLRFDPRKLEFKTGSDSTDLNTLVFKLVTKCERIPGVPRIETDPERLYTHPNVIAGDLLWQPKGEQETTFADEPPRPVIDDILLVKMRPGQELAAELHCEKGIGKDHAKFSPVATASYRLLPHILIHAPIPPHLCAKFASCFAPGVIRIRSNPRTGQRECVVEDPRKDTVSREVLRHPEFEGLVTLGRVRDHFIFNIESTGVYKPEELVPEACDVLLGKIRRVRESLRAQTSSGDDVEVVSAPEEVDGMEVDQ